MTDTERVQHWMETNDITIKALAEQMGLSYDGVYVIVTGRRPMNGSFKWRFAQAFGWDTAQTLFNLPSQPQQEQELQLA